MKALALIIFLFSNATLASNFKKYFNEESWEKVYDREGFSVKSQKAKNSRFVGFKAEAVLDAKLENVLAILRDVKNTTKWAPNMVEKTTIIEYSDLKALTYNNNDLPWPVADRDMILLNTLSVDKEKKVLVVETHSVTHPDYPPIKGIVRSVMPYATLEFKRHGDKSWVRMIVLVDPKGSIPVWIVNMVQKRFPVQFLKALENECQRVTLSLQPGIKTLVDELDQLNQIKK